MSAVRFQQVIAKLGHRATRWVENLFQIILPAAMVLYVGLFTRMANVKEALVILFVCAAFVCFSLFASSMLGLLEKFLISVGWIATRVPRCSFDASNEFALRQALTCTAIQDETIAQRFSENDASDISQTRPSEASMRRRGAIPASR